VSLWIVTAIFGALAAGVAYGLWDKPGFVFWPPLYLVLVFYVGCFEAFRRERQRRLALKRLAEIAENTRKA
jgi:hypothetical protein